MSRAPQQTSPSEDRMQKRLRELPMLPSVVSKIFALNPVSESYFEDVLEITREDPPFAIRLLRIANSSMSGPTSPISSLPLAISRLGAKTISNFLTTLAVEKVFEPSNDAERGLWIHAVEVAVCAKHIAALSTALTVDPESAYLCGLLHDIGCFVMLSPDAEERGPRETWDTIDESLKNERRSFGFDHAGFGWRVCQKWSLPDQVANLVRDHHVHTENATAPDSNPADQLVAVIQMADQMSLLLNEVDDIVDLQVEEQRDLIQSRCLHSAWPTPPVELDKLAWRLPQILRDIHGQLEGLSLG